MLLARQVRTAEDPHVSCSAGVRAGDVNRKASEYIAAGCSNASNKGVGTL